MLKKILSLLVLLTAATGAWAQTGMTNGLFSVSETKKVYFSKGNLQLVGENTFQFAENQWDYFGSNQSDNHRDLFCWGTGNTPNQTTGNSTFTDWGDNTYLQATLGKGWRTLTKDEFAYVFNTRASGSTVFGNANGRYTAATINTDGTGVKGLILFPDGITIAASEVTTAGAINGSGTLTQCTTAQWAALEEKGCVFLPAGGFILSGTEIGHGSITDYWSSTAADAIKAYNLGLNFAVPGAVVNTAGTLAYNYGLSVRLVIDGYVVTMKDGVKDADKWTVKVGEGQAYALPIGGLKGDGSETVTLQYNGRLKVKGVKATSDAGAPAAGKIIDLSKLTADYEAQNGDVLTRETTTYKVTIAPGATVTLDGVNIISSYYCIKCAGDATIILKDGTTNTLTSTSQDYPALWAGDTGTTLTIQSSTGVLNVTSGKYCAGIGGGYKNTDKTCGNIRIEGGVINAQGGDEGAGIGSDAGKATCGDIIITGGTITAKGGNNAAGIGTGKSGTLLAVCGNITIANTVTKVTATKGAEAAHSIGKGEGSSASCGTVTIGGTKYWENNAAVGDGDTYLATSPLIYDPAAPAKTPATVTTAPTGAAIVGVGKTTALVSGGVADGGTLMYRVTTENTMPASTDGFSDEVPTAKDITASGKVYVWYYVKGDDTHTDSEIAATAIEVPVADIVWDATNVTDIYVSGTWATYEKEGVTLSGNGEIMQVMYMNSGNPEWDGITFNAMSSGGFTFTAPTDKAFTKIEMKLTGPAGWDMAYNEAKLGTDWVYNHESDDESETHIYTVTWKGTAASTVDLLPDNDDFSGERANYIAFYLSE